MQREKGITLISITIYVIVMLIIVAVIAVLTSYFYKNMDITSTSQELNQQYTKFHTYFVKEVNKKGNKILEIGEIDTSNKNTMTTQIDNGNKNIAEDTENSRQSYIIFFSGNQYTYIPKNKAIYMNQIKIAQNITDCIFSTKEEANGKTTITVTIQGKNFERTTTYTLVD